MNNHSPSHDPSDTSRNEIPACLRVCILSNISVMKFSSNGVSFPAGIIRGSHNIPRRCLSGLYPVHLICGHWTYGSVMAWRVAYDNKNQMRKRVDAVN